MQVYIDKVGIKLKAKIGKILSFGGLAVMVIALLLSMSKPEYINTIFILAMIGLFSSQIGIGMINRWSRQPRVDEMIAASVKGLDSNFHLFQFKLGADHVLVSPTGVYSLIPALDNGKVLYEDGKWYSLKTKKNNKTKKTKNRDLAAQIERNIGAARKKFKSVLPETVVTLTPIVVFLHRDAEVNLENAPVLCVHQKKIKPLLRKLPKGSPLSEEDTSRLIEQFS
ncbi:MAG: hypothetical protein JXA25_02935 [Anaerolineales bacterium]|nr:hypothetical protein [Anaerolineales bacterium]